MRVTRLQVASASTLPWGRALSACEASGARSPATDASWEPALRALRCDNQALPFTPGIDVCATFFCGVAISARGLADDGRRSKGTPAGSAASRSPGRQDLVTGSADNTAKSGTWQTGEWYAR